jgi:hypothetical protein
MLPEVSMMSRLAKQSDMILVRVGGFGPLIFLIGIVVIAVSIAAGSAAGIRLGAGIIFLRALLDVYNLIRLLQQKRNE